MDLFNIETGFFLVDGGALFGVVPKLAWNAEYECDENNFCKLVMRSLLIKSKNKLILVDAGVGIKHQDVMSEFGFSGLKPVEEELKRLGFSCSDVTDVVLTHLHFEHCGGCTWIDYDFKLQMTFPNATHWVAEEQWKAMLNPSAREENSFFLADMMEVFKKEKLKWINDEQEIADGVRLAFADGHTKAQIVVYVNDGKENIIFAGDVVPTAANVPLDWLSAYDLDQVAALEAKRNILEFAVKNGSKLFFCHDKNVVSAKIAKAKDFYAVVE